jgi:DNA modification methylase
VEVQVEAVPTTRLQLGPWNPRSIKDERFQNHCASVAADPGFLYPRPILATKDGNVFACNMRLRAAQHLVWAEVPAVLVDIPEQLAKESALRDNAQWGDWSDDDLAKLLAELAQQSSDLDLLGFDDGDLQKLLNSIEHARGLADPDGVPPLSDEPITKAGDLWLLGEHRILCGVSTDAHDVAIATAGELARCLWTDPPYGVEYQSGSKRKLRIKNDGADGLVSLLRSAFASADAVLASGGVYYIAHADVFAFESVAAVRAQGWVQARPAVVVWVKDRQVLGWGNYHSRSEPLLCGWKPGAAHLAVADRTQDNVWEVARPARSEEHPTMKPVELIARALRNSTRQGDLVLDPFIDSGSTLIACEQLGRRCAGASSTRATSTSW